MLHKNQEEMNKHWTIKNQQRENIKIMGIDSKNQVNNIYFIILFYFIFLIN
jgi:hypothetical protein